MPASGRPESTKAIRLSFVLPVPAAGPAKEIQGSLASAVQAQSSGEVVTVNRPAADDTLFALSDGDRLLVEDKPGGHVAASGFTEILSFTFHPTDRRLLLFCATGKAGEHPDSGIYTVNFDGSGLRLVFPVLDDPDLGSLRLAIIGVGIGCRPPT